MNLKKIIAKHKIIAILILIGLVGGGYYGYGLLTKEVTVKNYVTTTLQKGLLVISVSGSGQISSSNQIDLKPKASGEITAIRVLAGQEVKTGALIAQLDATDAYKAVRDAKTSLETAQLSLERVLEPADNLSVIQSENALNNAILNKEKAEDDLEKAYDDAFTAISNAFLELPAIVTGLYDILYGYGYDRYLSNTDYYYDQIKSLKNSDYNNSGLLFRDAASTSYQNAKNAYDQNFNDYKATSRYADHDTVEKLLKETYDTGKLIAEAVKNADNYLSFVNDKLTESNRQLPNLMSTHQTSIAGYTSKVNSNISNLSTIVTTIKNSRESINTSLATINEKTESLKQVKSGSDELDIRSAKLAVLQKQQALADAQQALADYSVRAPFDGVIASVDAKRGESASSATIIAKLITKQQIAEITLNEVDVAKVKAGLKATLTFDAISDLSISGTVAEVDTIGTVSQNVVSYNVKITQDVQDERIKPGMSVSAAVITESKADILLAPNSAVKTSGEISYVEMFEEPLANSEGGQGAPSLIAPIRQEVGIGLINDDYTEIVSGLKEGDQIILKTVTASAGNSQSQSTSIFNLFGLSGNRSTNSTLRTINANSAAQGTAGGASSRSVEMGPGGPPPGF